MMSNQETIRLNHLGFNFTFDSLKFNAFMSMSTCPRFYVQISMPMSPCLHVHVSMSPFLHVSESHVYASMFLCLHLHISMSLCLRVCGIPQKENRTNRRRQLSYVCCKLKKKFVSLGWQMINGNLRLLFQQTCPSLTNSSLLLHASVSTLLLPFLC